MQTISQPKRYRFISLPQPESESIPPQLSRRISQFSSSNSPLSVTKPPTNVQSLPETIPPQVSRRLSQSSFSKSPSSAEKSPSPSTSPVSRLPASDSFSLFKLPLRLISNVLLPLIPPTIRQNTTSVISPLINFQMPLTFTTNHHSNSIPCNTNISRIPCNSVHYSTNNSPIPYNSHLFEITNNSPHDSLPCSSNNSPIPCNLQSGITNNTHVPCNLTPGIINNCSSTFSSLPCNVQNSSISLNHQSKITNNTSPDSNNHHDVSETKINLPNPCSHPKPGNNFYNLLCNCITLLNKVPNFSCTSHAVEDSSTRSPIDPDSFGNETDNTSKPAPSNTTPPIDVQPTDNTITDETQTYNTTIDSPSIDNSTPVNKDLSPTTTSNNCNSTASDSPTVTSDKPIHPCIFKHNHKINKPPIHTQKPLHFKPHSSSIYRIPAIHHYSQVHSKFHPPNHASCSSPFTFIHSLFKPINYKSDDISLHSQDELLLKMLQSLMSTSDLSLGSTDR